MKTTVQIPDSLFEEVQKLAREERTTMKALIEAGLRRVISERRQRQRFRLRKSTFKGKGLQPDFKNKRVTVVGMARSGVAAARALHTLGARVTVTDKKPLDQLAPQVKALGAGIAVEAGGHPDRLFIVTDLIVLSPGVPKIHQIATHPTK